MQPRTPLISRKVLYTIMIVAVLACLVPLLATSPLVAAGGTTHVVMENSNGSTGLPLYLGRTAHVEYITSQSDIAGKEIDAIQLRLSRVGFPTGAATVGVFDSNLILTRSFGTIEASSVAAGYRDYTFSLDSPGGGHVLRPGDGVGILYEGGDAGNHLSVIIDASGLFDGRRTFHRYYHEAGWTSQLDGDMHMKLTSKREPRPQPARYVMIHFDDGFKSQYDHAYPVLEQYGLKGTFWIVCDYASGAKPGYMSWAQIDELAAAGHDVQNHGMTHARLPALTDEQIAREVGVCKEMVMRHGSTGDAFAIPFNDGDDDPRVVGIISAIHAYGKGSGGAPQRADCGRGNCEILNADGTYNKNNRYTMAQWSHDGYIRNGNMTEREILDGFVRAVNLGGVDAVGGIVRIPIITYHRINEGGTSPSASLFAEEMRYLRDNGFRTIGMDDITYDQQAKRFRLR